MPASQTGHSLTVFGYAIPGRSSIPPSSIGNRSGFPGGMSCARWAADGIGLPAQRTCMAIHPDRPSTRCTCRITDTLSLPPIGCPHTAQTVNPLPPFKPWPGHPAESGRAHHALKSYQVSKPLDKLYHIPGNLAIEHEEKPETQLKRKKPPEIFETEKNPLGFAQWGRGASSHHGYVQVNYKSRSRNLSRAPSTWSRMS